MTGGPLEGVRIVDLTSVVVGPLATQILADHGAEVIRIDRASGGRGGSQPVAMGDVLARGRKSIAVDVKSEVPIVGRAYGRGAGPSGEIQLHVPAQLFRDVATAALKSRH